MVGRKRSLRKATIFVSYADPDRSAAIRFREWLVNSTGATLDVFVAADRDALPLGDLWYDAITATLTEADMVIVLVSFDALRSPWVAFEAGHASALKKPILPLLLPGFPPQMLRSPLSFRQYVTADAPNVLTQVISKINEEFHTKFVGATPTDSPVFAAPTGSVDAQLSAVGLASRQDIYDEIASLVNAARFPLYLRGTATLRESRGFSDKWFEAYITAVASRFAQAERSGAAGEFTLVMAFPTTADNMPPDDRIATLRLRQAAFEQVGAANRLRLFHTTDQWSLDVLTVGNDHAVIGFPARTNEIRMRNAVRITGEEFVTTVVQWFDHVVLPAATPIDPLTLRVGAGA
jgi:hypothetical protein